MLSKAIFNVFFSILISKYSKAQLCFISETVTIPLNYFNISGLVKECRILVKQTMKGTH